MQDPQVLNVIRCHRPLPCHALVVPHTLPDPHYKRLLGGSANCPPPPTRTPHAQRPTHLEESGAQPFAKSSDDPCLRPTHSCMTHATRDPPAMQPEESSESRLANPRSKDTRVDSTGESPGTQYPDHPTPLSLRYTLPHLGHNTPPGTQYLTGGKAHASGLVPGCVRHPTLALGAPTNLAIRRVVAYIRKVRLQPSAMRGGGSPFSKPPGEATVGEPRVAARLRRQCLRHCRSWGGHTASSASHLPLVGLSSYSGAWSGSHFFPREATCFHVGEPRRRSERWLRLS